jgi:chorismate-pyruvate lyase
MFFGALESQLWQSVRRWNAAEAGMDRNAAGVLTTAGSLTRFLERHFGIRLEVRLLDQFFDVVRTEEAGMLECVAAEPALRRQVSLMHRGSVMFNAESVLPLEDLPADLMQELQAGKRPLGNLLLDRGLSLARSDLSVAQINDDGAYQGCWARRSVLRSASETRALVVEVFQPLMWKRIESASRRY